jgi:hypothetical protein|nr:hypothetical protein [uncultured Porphyromonas sp.]
MELVVQILMLFVALGTALRLTFERGWILPLLFGAVASVFVYLTYPYAIEQTKTGLAGYIADRSLREYAAIFISLDVALVVGYSFSRLTKAHTQRGRVVSLVLRLYPGVLLFPVLFYLQSTLIFALPGVDFGVVSLLLSLGTLVLVLGLVYLLRFLLPEEELRLEVLFLVELFIFILGIIASVDETIRTAPEQSPIQWRGLALTAVVALICFVVGYFAPRIRRTLRSK